MAQKAATCTEPGNVEHYTCSGCKDVFSDSKGIKKIKETAIAPLGHTASDVWGVDDQLHWRVCTTCNQVMIETQMVHELENGICTTCAYEVATAEDTTPTPTETVPEPTPETEPQPQGEPTSTRWIPLLIGLCVVGALVVSGLTVVIVILLLKLKKTKK